MQSDTSVNAYSILIVDDEKLNLELLTRRLSIEGYSITTASNGEEAVKLLAIERFDLMLLDLNMPVMNGYEVLESLSSQGKQDMRIIMLTAAGERDAVNACLTLGAHDYVLKSAGLVELLHRVNRACRDSRLEARLGTQGEPRSWDDCHILVVDDNAMSLGLMMRRFQHDDISTHIANDGQTALKLLEQTRIDLVLLDY